MSTECDETVMFYGKSCRSTEIKDGWCHQCKMKQNKLYTCINLWKSKKDNKCNGKYCAKCIEKHYNEDIERLKENEEWTCYSCQKLCICAACKRKRGENVVKRKSPCTKGQKKKPKMIGDPLLIRENIMMHQNRAILNNYEYIQSTGYMMHNPSHPQNERSFATNYPILRNNYYAQQYHDTYSQPQQHQHHLMTSYPLTNQMQPMPTINTIYPVELNNNSTNYLYPSNINNNSTTSNLDDPKNNNYYLSLTQNLPVYQFSSSSSHPISLQPSPSDLSCASDLASDEETTKSKISFLVNKEDQPLDFDQNEINVISTLGNFRG